MNTIEYDEKNINKEILREFFEYQNSSFPAKELYKANQAKNEQMVNQINDALIDLKGDVIRKTISEMKIQMKQLILLKKSLILINNKKGKN